LEKDIEPELVAERIAELRAEKEELEQALDKLGTEREEAESEELTKHLGRIPDLGKALRESPAAVQRQVFEAFELEIAYDKAGRRIEISATVSEAVAAAFENKKALPKEGSRVLLKEVAGAGFEPATFGL
jgi:hypothetical protein